MNHKRFGAVCIFFLVMVALVGCGAPKSSVGDRPVYNKYNIHAQGQTGRGGLVYQASYANYTSPGAGHLIIPAGSQIKISDVSSRRFTVHYPEKNIQVQFEYHEPRMGMKVGQYLEAITSEEPVSYASLSEVDQKGIEQGKALVGMSRTGVMAALGYPAGHRTLSLDADAYVYWTNRFGTIAVDFDDQGRVKNIRN
ncbi:hypothetical protein [Geoalkalibacter halelectricus]|uniref:Uncharacterized protein n=1 Tax=Geoalkalibacter halelectricus TaxID=2847045 RepID=A0ABY5ZMR3_9BACT|nr:hypothetical protein [Geoalkalibacter halelectricus]MDO3379803.1 hypothetical protein [Geoalkalibacter halelectricus]UWZ79237.1 hypothetical protein L9S41_16375 [Geoalkalibacter halelectricus]